MALLVLELGPAPALTEWALSLMGGRSSPKAAELFARDDDVERMNYCHWPHDREDRQAQAAKAEQPEDQVQPKGTGLNSHLGGNGQGR